MSKNFFGELGEKLRELPREVGTEVVGQFKGNNQNQNSQNPQGSQGSQNPQNPQQADQNQQQFLNDLYGASEMSPEQIDVKKKQDDRKKTANYNKIQQDIQAYRSKKKQEKTKYEIGWQEGTDAARNQQEEMELWEIQKKKAEEKKKKDKDASSPGSAQKRGGEQGKVMG